MFLRLTGFSLNITTDTKKHNSPKNHLYAY
jgi:hypothetical protein